MTLILKNVRLSYPHLKPPSEPYGPVTLTQMSMLYEEYRRARKLAEHNINGWNPSLQGAAGRKVGEALQAKADRLARSFPRFAEMFDDVR